MHVSGLLSAPVTGTLHRPPARQVQPVDRVATRHSPAYPRNAGRPVPDAALEGELLDGAEQRSNAPFTARQVLPGALVNASRAISAYANVASATSPANEQKRRRLDLRV